MLGKIVLITGAHNKIGASVARRFASEGASLVLPAVDLSDLGELDQDIRKLGGESVLVQTNISDILQIEALAASITGMSKKLDALVAAHFYTSKPNVLVDYEVDEWKKILEENFSLNWYLLKHFDGLLKLSGSGRVIFISVESIVGKNPLYFSPYVASNAGLVQLMNGYSNDVQTHGIKVNMIALEGYEDSPSLEPHPDCLELFVTLASDRYKISGRKHYVSYT
ncbi:short chain dehydrogenase family protein [Neorickettsia helminthoeca str. Oregon]|uniref:Short chain dehydrogenase family protein n=2 Tax=Neorickettsia helminthoeca TaxID=33994 RepID=X5HJU5_9RICK|nr:short chain dehydrogenase family protein [Neorickettsia helminthoeca str. Oregon]